MYKHSFLVCQSRRINEKAREREGQREREGYRDRDTDRDKNRETEGAKKHPKPKHVIATQ